MRKDEKTFIEFYGLSSLAVSSKPPPIFVIPSVKREALNFTRPPRTSFAPLKVTGFYLEGADDALPRILERA